MTRPTGDRPSDGDSGTNPSGTTTLEGTLDKVVYFNEENAWSVVRVIVDGRRNPVTAVGNLLGVQPGESLRLHGTWINDKRFGEQLKVSSYLTVKPSTLVGIEKYLGSGMVKGVGAAIASRLVAQFGLDTLDVIDNHPERLREVEGIGPVRSQRFLEAWTEQRHVKDVMVFLQSHGISSTYAVKIYKQYADRAVAVVRANPYRLAEDIFGIGFRTADQIAASLGIEKTSPRRAEAGLLHVLGEAADDGHVYCPRADLLERAAEVLDVPLDIVAPALVALAESARVVIDPGPFRGAVDQSEAVYLAQLHRVETAGAATLRKLLATPLAPISIDIERAVAWYQETQSLDLAGQQKEALRQAIACKVLVITGGPGTGKTTIINGVIRILEKKGRRILLAAPTGRAAKRLNEATGREAKTLHRQLEFSPKTGSFERNEKKPFEADVVIIDEMSMVDTTLLHDLLLALPPRCQLILVGDVDQLPSVGPGSVLRDLIRCGVIPVVTLTEIFRQAEASRIVVNAHRVNAGEMPLVETEPNQLSDFYLIEREDPDAVLATIKELVATRIPRQFGMNAIVDIQVLTPMHRGTLGAANLNDELQSLLNPAGESIARGTRLFRVGDKVMQLRNNYDLEVFNGDIGQVVSIDADDRTMTVRFESRHVRYEYGDLDELVLAYACTIHKSQGSEYGAVVVPLHTQHYAMLQRNLLYTGITRGKRLVVIVGSRRALGIAIRNDRVLARHTHLAERLAESST